MPSFVSKFLITGDGELLTAPASDGSAGQILQTDGNGQLSFTIPSSNGMSDLIDDTTPQLGGNLDVNGNSIVSVSNGNISLIPDGTGNVVLGTLTFDGDMAVTSDEDGYVLTYDDSTGTVSLEVLPTTSKIDVKNDTAGTLLKGRAVHVTGSHASGKPTIEYADSSSASTMNAIGILEADIAAGGEGNVILAGIIENIDTSSYTSGDTLYVGTSGVLTDTKPTGTDLIQNMGMVGRSHESVGSFIVIGSGRSNDVPNLPQDFLWLGNASGVATPTNKNEITELSDDTTPQLGGNLDMNGFAFSSPAAIDNDAAGPEVGLLFQNSGTSNAEIQYDDGAQDLYFAVGDTVANGATKMTIENGGNVGIGTSSPTTPLHVYEDTTSTTGGLLIEQDGTGDALAQFLLTGGKRYVMGIDNSDGDDAFVMTSGTSLASGKFFYSNPNTGQINVGFGNTATGSAVCLGYYAGSAGTFATNVGVAGVTYGDYSCAFGFSAITGGDYATAIGSTSYADGNQSLAVGSNTSASAEQSTSVGYSTKAQGTDSSAFGCRAKTTIANTFESGYWSGSTTRSGSVRTHPNGQVALTIEDSATAPTDGGATAGSEADGTLPREMYSVQRDGDQLKMYVNDAGTIKEIPLGPVIQIHAEENSSLNTGVNSGYQFSFGNGANTTRGIAVAYPGVVSKLAISTQAITSGQVELYVNGAATGAVVNLTSARTSIADISVSVVAGDQITFRTISGSGGGVVCVSATILGALV